VKVSPEEIAQIAQALAAVAGVFSPANAASIALLVQAGTQVNLLIQRVRNQTEAEAQKVWEEVRTDWKASVASFEASQKP
jgi:hypothetical protein